jgi:nucleoside-diphosphate-sugar epimerase
MPASRILVTGATGSTGREVVRAPQHTDHTVRAMIRREDARADVLRELGAEIVLGDLLDIDSVRVLSRTSTPPTLATRSSLEYSTPAPTSPSGHRSGRGRHRQHVAG